MICDLLSQWKEGRLRRHENKMLRRIFGRKREEGIGNWRKMHNEELCNLCSETNETN
jgi:hypothetical protein